MSEIELTFDLEDGDTQPLPDREVLKRTVDETQPGWSRLRATEIESHKGRKTTSGALSYRIEDDIGSKWPCNNISLYSWCVVMDISAGAYKPYGTIYGQNINVAIRNRHYCQVCVSLMVS